MQAVLTALGSYGDVYPMVGLGAAMRDRGHDVTVVAMANFESLVRGAGLGYEPVSTAERYEQLTKRKELWSPSAGLSVIVREAAIGVIEELTQTLECLHRPGETVIAAHGLDLASRVFAETHGVPVASIVYAPMALWSDRSPPRLPAGFAPMGAPRWLHKLQFVAAERLVLRRLAVRDLEAFRATRGLPPLRGGYWDWYYGVAPPVCLFPDWFVSPGGTTPPDWPEGTVTTGFPMGDSLTQAPLPAELTAFLDAGTPPIVFTPGSAMRHGQRFFAAATQACGRLGRRGVLLTKYPEQLPDDLPEGIIAPGFTPLAPLLARSAAFVHHGGIGSSARGLAAGVPQLIQPMAFDQPDNAWRLRRLGVAEELKPSRFTGRRVATTLDRLLSEPRYAEAARRWATRVDAGAALIAACAAIEGRLVDS